MSDMLPPPIAKPNLGIGFDASTVMAAQAQPFGSLLSAEANPPPEPSQQKAADAGAGCTDDCADCDLFLNKVPNRLCTNKDEPEAASLSYCGMPSKGAGRIRWVYS